MLLIVVQQYQIYKENSNREILRVLSEVENNIDQNLKANYTITLTLALTIDENGIPHNFSSVAEQLIKANRHLRAVQLVPDGIIKYIYPLPGNEKALNLNLFKSAVINATEAKRAIESKEMYYQGPIALTQGGIGLIGRLPLFINNKFWGFSAIVIDLDTFLKSLSINNQKYKGYHFQFSKINPITKKEEFFLPVDKHISFDHAKSVLFNEGDWKLYVVNDEGFDDWFSLIGMGIFGLSLAILSSYLLTRLISKQADLQFMLAEQALQLVRTESKFKGIFDHAAIGIARVHSKSGELLEVNRYLCDFLGYSEAELMHKKIKNLIHPDDVAEDSRLFKLFLNGSISKIKDEKRYIHKSGEVRWGSIIVTPLWADGEEPNNHIIILEDSGERKAAAQVLIESQKRTEALINNIDGIVWEGDMQSKRYSFVSKKAEDILGYPVQEWITDPEFWLKHLHPDDRPKILPEVKRNLDIPQHHDHEYRMIAKDGAVVWIRDIVSVVEEEGQPNKVGGIMIDITEQKHAGDALNSSYLLVTEQNKRLLNFSYIVSHNLRSHASNIQGIIGLIEGASSAREQEEMIQLLKTVANNLNETLLNLNHVVNIQNRLDIEVEQLSLRAYILKTLSTLNGQLLARNIKVENHIQDDVQVEYNKAYLESVLLNLISNSIRYGDPKRSLNINLSCYKVAEQLVLEVADNGIGIDLKKYGDKMFGMFQTFNGNADARGYGLFITKNQVEAMGGKIEVESVLGVGTSFKIYFK